MGDGGAFAPAPHASHASHPRAVRALSHTDGLAAAAAMPVDYSKFDKVVDSDDEDAAPSSKPREEPRAAPAPSYNNDNPRAEIEKLKAEKRKAREAREAAEAAAGGGKAAEEPTPEPPPAAPTEPAESEPLALLRKAEDIKAQIVSGMATAEGALQSGEPVELKEITNMNGLVGMLQGLIDSISLGDLEEGAVRDGARARRKGLNAFVEDAMPGLATLRSKALPAK